MHCKGTFFTDQELHCKGPILKAEFWAAHAVVYESSFFLGGALGREVQLKISTYI